MLFRTEAISADDLTLDLGILSEIVLFEESFAHATKKRRKLGKAFSAQEEAIMVRYLERLPNFDYRILEYFKAGKKHCEIAAQLGTDEDLGPKVLGEDLCRSTRRNVRRWRRE